MQLSELEKDVIDTTELWREEDIEDRLYGGEKGDMFSKMDNIEEMHLSIIWN